TRSDTSTAWVGRHPLVTVVQTSGALRSDSPRSAATLSEGHLRASRSVIRPLPSGWAISSWHSHCLDGSKDRRRQGGQMINTRRLSRRLAATLSLAAAGCGIAIASAAGTAQAATPNAWGYALVLKPSGPVAANHWKESVASPTPTASPGVPGQVLVSFPKIG